MEVLCSGAVSICNIQLKTNIVALASNGLHKHERARVVQARHTELHAVIGHTASVPQPHAGIAATLA